MRIIRPSVSIISDTDALKTESLRIIEAAGRVCYKSEEAIKPGSAERFIEKIIERGHESVIEHFFITVRFICDRGVSHEIVRHRIASFSQESTRYCNYADMKFGSELTFIEPVFYYDGQHAARRQRWEQSCLEAESAYFTLIEEGASPEEARCVLPNAVKTELVMTANIREWRHFLKLRTANAAHPQMRELAGDLASRLRGAVPVFFAEYAIT